MQTTSFTQPGVAELAAIERQRKIAQALQAQAMQPIEQNPVGQGQFAVPISPLQSAAKLAQAFVGARKGRQADEAEQRLVDQQGQRRSADVGLLAGALQARPAAPGGLVEDASGNVTQSDPMPAQGVPERLQQALSMIKDPALQQAGMGLLSQHAAAAIPPKPTAYTLKPGEQRRGPNNEIIAEGAVERPATDTTRVVAPGGSVVDRNGKVIYQAPDRPQENQPVTTTTVMHRGVPTVVNARAYKGEGSDAGVIGPANKPANTQLPPAALREQQEHLDAMGIAGNINADLGAILGQLSETTDEKGNKKPPTLQLGPVNNAIGAARTAIGWSNENSRNLGTFKATLAKLQNDSLRLNKGVQTEGDAVRAWNEILTNINDQEFVKKRLGEVQLINERAVRQRQMQIDGIRRNYGLDPIDTSAMSKSPPAIGTPARPQQGGPVNWSDL